MHKTCASTADTSTEFYDAKTRFNSEICPLTGNALNPDRRERKSGMHGRNEMSRVKSMIGATTGIVLCLFAGTASSAELVIAAMPDITGTNAGIGSRISKGFQLAAEHINESKMLGNDTLKFIMEDSATEKGQAVTLMNRFVLRDKALLVIGPAASPVAMAVSPLANEMKTPFMSAGYNDAVLDAGPWTLKFPENSEDHGEGLVKYAVEKLKPKRCFFVYSHDNIGYVDQFKVFSKGVIAGGAANVGEATVVAADTDFSVIATRIAAAQPDCLHVAMSAEGGANVILQARQAGMSANTKLFGGASQASAEYIRSSGPAGDGIMVFSDYTPGGLNAEGKKFEEAYLAKYKEPADNWATVGYALMMHVGWGLKASQPNVTKEKLLEVMTKAKDVPTIIGATGKYSLNAQRQPKYGATVVMVKGGKIISAP